VRVSESDAESARAFAGAMLIAEAIVELRNIRTLLSPKETR